MTLRQLVSIPAIVWTVVVWPASANSDDAAKASPFHRELSIPLGASKNTARFRVPEGKRLLIEHVSAHARLPFGQDLLLWIETTVNGERAAHFVVPSWTNWRRVTAPDYDIIRIRQSLRLYADSGTTVLITAERSGNWGGGAASVTVSGLLAQAP